jgi:type I restriction enzyme S subunit
VPGFPLVPLGEVITYAPDPHEVNPDGKYPIAGVYGFGRGMIQRAAVAGSEMAATQLFRIRAGQFIYSRLKSFEGAYSIVSAEVDGYFVSNEFPTFDLDREQIEPEFLGWYFKQHRVWQQLASDGRGIGARRERLHPKRLLDHIIPVPTLEQQRSITARLDAAAAAIAKRKASTGVVNSEIEATLRAAFARIVTNAPRSPMRDVAPLVRRAVRINREALYSEIGVRSFYRGLFTRRTVKGEEFDWQKLFEIKSGDLVFSNLMAWERAIALADDNYHGAVGNHRMLTCEVDSSRATPEFLFYYFTTEDGFRQILSASPGTMVRNKTLSTKLLPGIEVPTPPLEAQQWFNDLQAKARAARRAQADASADLDGLLPAMLHEVFGE